MRSVSGHEGVERHWHQCLTLQSFGESWTYKTTYRNPQDQPILHLVVYTESGVSDRPLRPLQRRHPDPYLTGRAKVEQLVLSSKLKS